MKILTIAEGRKKFRHWLRKATQGEDIRFKIDNKIVALRLLKPRSSDYTFREYGLTPREVGAAEKRIVSEVKKARGRGELTRFNGRTL